MEEIGKACSDCRYYDGWEGFCLNPCSERFGEAVVGFGACDGIVEEDE